MANTIDLARTETKDALRAAMPALPVRRYTPARKAAILAAIAGNAVTESEARAAYDISAPELAAWQRDIAAHGVAGLRITRLQQYALLGE